VRCLTLSLSSDSNNALTLMPPSQLPQSRHGHAHLVVFTSVTCVLYACAVSSLANKQVTTSCYATATCIAFPLQIVAKPQQIVTRLLLTAYRNLPTSYPTVPSPTPYDVPFSHST